MTIAEAERIMAATASPYLKRDMKRFIQRQRRKERSNGGSKTADRSGCGQGA